MPYKSEKQRRYLHLKHPEIAARWDREVKKSAWEIVHKMGPDQADVHITATLRPVTGKKPRPRRRKVSSL